MCISGGMVVQASREDQILLCRRLVGQIRGSNQGEKGSNIVLKHPNMSNIVLKHPNMSNIVLKHPNMSKW